MLVPQKDRDPERHKTKKTVATTLSNGSDYGSEVAVTGHGFCGVDAASQAKAADAAGSSSGEGDDEDAPEDADEGGISVLEALQQASEDEDDIWKPFSFEKEERRSKL